MLARPWILLCADIELLQLVCYNKSRLKKEDKTMTDNKSAFAVNQYDENVRKVIPHYDEIYEQIFSVINTYCGDKPLAVLDTGCGTGILTQ